MTDHKPNIGNARMVTQVDGPGGLSVLAWRMTKDGEGVVEVVRAKGSKPEVLRFTEAELRDDEIGWTLFDTLRSRQLDGGFSLSPVDVTPLVNAMQLAVRALKDNPATVAEDKIGVE